MFRNVQAFFLTSGSKFLGKWVLLPVLGLHLFIDVLMVVWVLHEDDSFAFEIPRFRTRRGLGCTTSFRSFLLP
jgi:hypothetical protein